MHESQSEPDSATCFGSDGLAVILGASGGIGGCLFQELSKSGRFLDVLGFSRSGVPPFDIRDEPSVKVVANAIAARGLPVRLVVVATGFLHGDGFSPEKSWREIDLHHMAHAFVTNTIGPALVMKHFLPLMPRCNKSVFVMLSAKVGSIGDNRLGGWYSYRASKAALNQLVRTASIELRRVKPEAICVAVHPGTVETELSAPFSKTGLKLLSPKDAAKRLISVIEGVSVRQNGTFIDYQGNSLPW